MEILKIAIQAEGSVGKLAEALDIRQNVVSNWRARGVPKSWAQVLLLKYGQKQDQAQAAPAQPAINAVADASAAIKHVEAVAVAAIRQEAGQATAEIKHVAEELLKDDEPWDGATDRRKADELWDGKSERRKLDAPIDRRVSTVSVARADWLRTQAAVKAHDIAGTGA